MLKPFAATLVLFCVVGLTRCSSTPKSPDVAGSIRQALDQSGFKDVSVTQDRDRGVVALGGHVAADADKDNAESIAKGFARHGLIASPPRRRRKNCQRRAQRGPSRERAGSKRPEGHVHRGALNGGPLISARRTRNVWKVAAFTLGNTGPPLGLGAARESPRQRALAFACRLTPRTTALGECLRCAHNDQQKPRRLKVLPDSSGNGLRLYL